MKGADAVLFAVQWGAREEGLRQAGALAGKTLLTCMIPTTPDDSELAVAHTTSGAEELARETGAHVVAIFDTITSELLRDDAEVARMHPDVLYCGDHEPSKAIAAELARSAGFNPVDAGALRFARYLEPFGMLVAQLDYEMGLSETAGYRFLLPAREGER